jgi:hypothetical protein
MDKDMDDPFEEMKLTRWSAELPPDLVDYIDTCQRGEFYAELARIWDMQLETPNDRNEVKRAAFKWILFGPVRHGKSRWQAFKLRWPSVATALEEIKRDDHGTSARACQRIEAKLMVEGVVGRLMGHDSNLAVLTIHDSVLVKAHDVERAIKAIRTEFAVLGLEPSIKVKQETATHGASTANQTEPGTPSTSGANANPYHVSSQTAPIAYE